MPEAITQEQVLQKANEAMSAMEPFKEFVKKNEQKLDALDIEAMKKMEKSILDAADASQKLSGQLDAEKKAAEAAKAGLEAEIKRLTETGEATEKDLNELKGAFERLSIGGKGGDDEEKSKRALSKKAFNDFARLDNENRIPFKEFIDGKPEYKDLTVGSQPDGGYLVTPTIAQMVTTRQFETSPIRQIANVVTIGTDAYEIPLDNDEAATGGWVGETQSRPNTGTPQLGEQRIPVNEQYANPRVSQKMLDDAAMDIEAWLAKKVADKMTRIENTAFIAGDGNKKPRGFLTYSDLATPGTFQQGAIEEVASGVTGGLGYDGLIDLMTALKDGYEPRARFVGQRASFGKVMKIKDGESRPIFNMMYNNGGGIALNILGKDFTFAADMPAVVTGALALAYGDFEEGYTIVDRTGIRTLRDPYTAKPFVQFYTTKRVGGDVTNFEALKLLRIS